MWHDVIFIWCVCVCVCGFKTNLRVKWIFLNFKETHIHAGVDACLRLSTLVWRSGQIDWFYTFT